MTTATIDAPKVEKEPSIRERAVDAARQVARGVAVGWIGARFGKAKFTCDG